MAFLATLALEAASPESILYVGTFTRAESKGIYAFRFNSLTGLLTPIGLVAEASNPAFLAIHPNRQWLFAANEDKDGMISSFAIDPATAKLKPINRVSVQGASPCHISLNRRGTILGVANYSSGNAGLFAIGSDGRLAEGAMVQHRGSGSHPRQSEPHAHSINISRNGRFAVVADLGIDQIRVYRVDAERAKLTPHDPPAANLSPGSGPRHFAFHPSQKYAYVNNELSSTVTAFRFQASTGKFKELQTLSTLPADFRGENYTAETVVHPSGRFLYVSNRGHHSIAMFRIDAKTGKLEFQGTVSSGGQWPRNFNLDPSGKFLLAANERSNSIFVFAVDPATGKLTPTGAKVDTPTPVCLRFLPL